MTDPAFDQLMDVPPVDTADEDLVPGAEDLPEDVRNDDLSEDEPLDEDNDGDTDVDATVQGEPIVGPIDGAIGFVDMDPHVDL